MFEDGTARGGRAEKGEGNHSDSKHSKPEKKRRIDRTIQYASGRQEYLSTQRRGN